MEFFLFFPKYTKRGLFVLYVGLLCSHSRTDTSSIVKVVSWAPIFCVFYHLFSFTTYYNEKAGTSQARTCSFYVDHFIRRFYASFHFFLLHYILYFVIFAVLLLCCIVFFFNNMDFIYICFLLFILYFSSFPFFHFFRLYSVSWFCLLSLQYFVYLNYFTSYVYCVTSYQCSSNWLCLCTIMFYTYSYIYIMSFLSFHFLLCFITYFVISGLHISGWSISQKENLPLHESVKWHFYSQIFIRRIWNVSLLLV